MKSIPFHYEYGTVTLREVTDGDSVVLTIRKTLGTDVDLGFRMKSRLETTLETTLPFRLFGINTPELIGVTREAGLAARAELIRLVWGEFVGLRATTYKPDKYGRWLVDLWARAALRPEFHVNAMMISGGFAKPYFGVGDK